MSATVRAAPLTHARMLRIAGPMVISNATVPLVGVVDSAVVGQLGDPVPIGAVAIGASLLNAFYWFFGFLRMGTTGLAAQAMGAGDGAESAAVLSRATLIAVTGGVLLIALQVPLFAAAFALSPASPEVTALAHDYLAIRIWSAPALIAAYGLTGWLIAAERTRGVLIAQIATNGVNIALDLWFVLGLGWGVEGVAIATFLAEWTGLAVGLWFCRDAFAGRAWRNWPLVLSPARLRHMALLNTDILIRSALLLSVVVSFVVVFSAGFGDVTLAANQILMQFLTVTAFALDGFAFAAESLVGQAVGARSRDRLRRAVWISALWCAVTGVGLAVLFAAAGGPIIDLMTTAPDVRAVARDFLPWMIACPLLGFAAWILDGIFIGATRGADMRNMMAVSVAIFFAAVWLLIPAFGNHGLWAALIISYLARAGTLGLRYGALEHAVLEPSRASARLGPIRTPRESP